MSQAAEPIMERWFVGFVSAKELEGFNVTVGLDEAVQVCRIYRRLRVRW